MKKFENTEIIEKESTYTVKDIEITFMEKNRVDKETGKIIYDPTLEQENDIVLYNIYRNKKGLLLPNEIKAIREQYGLSQKNLSRILGWGEKTITRYENGSIQDLGHNKMLNLIKDPIVMNELLITPGMENELGEKEYNKLKHKIIEMLKLEMHFKIALDESLYLGSIQNQEDIFNLCNWILDNYDYEKMGEKITHLKLQKLLYYYQGLSCAIYDKPIFNNTIEAWVHGPVVKEVYDKYKIYGYDPIPLPNKKVVLDNSDLEPLFKKILRYYGELSAKQLENLTHKEFPWKNARKGLSNEDRGNIKIKVEDMRSYFKILYSL